MGLHFPFYGYVQNLGSRYTRAKQIGAWNRKKLFSVSEFFAGIDESKFLELQKSQVPPPVTFGQHIGETFFETDLKRPELTRFLAINGKKTLVIQSYDNLFERRSALLDKFCRACFLEFWPIIDLEDAHFPIKPSVMNNTKDLSHYLMQNQDKVRDRIIGRMAQYHIPRKFNRYDK